MSYLGEDVPGSPSEVCPDPKRELLGSMRPDPPAQPVWAGPRMLLDCSHHFVNAEEVFLPILDDPDPVAIKSDGSRVLRVQS